MPPSSHINLISGIPGSGKTRFVLNFCQDHPDEKIILLSHSHTFLTECESRLETATHWRGMRRICERREEPHIQSLIRAGAPVRWICTICGRDSCVYKLQFSESENIVLSPIEYLQTKYIRDFNPFHIFLDDVTLRIRELTPLTEMRRWVEMLKHYGIIAEHQSFDNVLNYADQFSTKIENRIKSILRVINHDEPIPGILTTHRLFIDPSVLIQWKRVFDIYGEPQEGESRERFGVPYLFEAFKLGDEKSVTILDAIHNQRFLQNMQERFMREENMQVRFYERQIEFEVTENIIRRVMSPRHGEATFCRETLSHQHQRAVIKERNRVILEVEGFLYRRQTQNNFFSIGLITFKDVNPWDLLPDSLSPDSVKTLHFGDLRGKNILEDVDILIIVGTYFVNPEAIVESYQLFYVYPPETDEAVRVRGHGYRWLDLQLDNFSKMKQDYEIYQAIHRARPALRRVPIYVHGVVPEWIFDEFRVENVIVDCVGNRVRQDSHEKEYVLQLVRDRGGELEKRLLAELLINEFHEGRMTREGMYLRINHLIEEIEELEIVPRRLGGRGRPRHLIVERLNERFF